METAPPFFFVSEAVASGRLDIFFLRVPMTKVDQDGHPLIRQRAPC